MFTLHYFYAVTAPINMNLTKCFVEVLVTVFDLLLVFKKL